MRVTAAFFLSQIDQKKNMALRSLAEVITTASDKSSAKGRAWANVLLLGAKAREIEAMLQNTTLQKKDQAALSMFRSRILQP